MASTDVASLAMRRLWERLESGVCSVSPADAAALVRLARETGRERAPGHSDEAWQASARDLARRQAPIYLASMTAGYDGDAGELLLTAVAPALAGEGTAGQDESVGTPGKHRHPDPPGGSLPWSHWLRIARALLATGSLLKRRLPGGTTSAGLP